MIADYGSVIADYTVEAVGMFTVHKGGCFHTRAAASRDQTFDIQSAAKSQTEFVLTELEEYIDSDDWTDCIAFAPCVSLPKGGTR